MQPSCKTKVLSQDTRCHSCATKTQSQVTKPNLAAKLQSQVTEPRHLAETRVANIAPKRQIQVAKPRRDERAAGSFKLIPRKGFLIPELKRRSCWLLQISPEIRIPHPRAKGKHHAAKLKKKQGTRPRHTLPFLRDQDSKPSCKSQSCAQVGPAETLVASIFPPRRTAKSCWLLQISPEMRIPHLRAKAKELLAPSN